MNEHSLSNLEKPRQSMTIMVFLRWISKKILWT